MKFAISKQWMAWTVVPKATASVVLKVACTTNSANADNIPPLDPERIGGHGLRIDFRLGTEAVRARTKRVWVDRDYRKKQDGLTASDHAPVIADLD